MGGQGYQLIRTKHTVLGIIIENMDRFTDFTKTENLKWREQWGARGLTSGPQTPPEPPHPHYHLHPDGYATGSDSYSIVIWK